MSETPSKAAMNHMYAVLLGNWTVRLAREVRSIISLNVQLVPEVERLAFVVAFKYTNETFEFIVPDEVKETIETGLCHETMELLYSNLVDAIVDIEDHLIDMINEGDD